MWDEYASGDLEEAEESPNLKLSPEQQQSFYKYTLNMQKLSYLN